MLQAENNDLLQSRDPHWLQYHIMPPTGLLNDPNGLIHFKGKYHVFYQWNPFATSHGAKFWGHCTSSDLVSWQVEKTALAPSHWFDKNGCYSGSAIDHEGKMYLFYTGNVKDAEGNRQTYQCMAVSDDGKSFRKKGPVIRLPKGFTAHFRDPKVFSHNGQFYMVIGAQNIEKNGCCVLFVSQNLYDWEYMGILAGSRHNGWGDYGYMWECPDLFSQDNKDVLLICPQGIQPQGEKYRNIYQAGYFLGEMDYQNSTFHAGSFTELDCGFDFYAPQTFLDERGRRILIAWMGITDENEALHPTIAYRWVHAMTIPREVLVKDEKLYQRPVPELKKLRCHYKAWNNVVINGETEQLKTTGKSLELCFTRMDINNEAFFSIDFWGYTTLAYDAKQQKLILTRKSLKNKSCDEQRVCSIKSLSALQIFLDASSLEIFVNDGEKVFTARIFPDSNQNSITLSSLGKTAYSLEKWDLNPMNN